MASGGIPAITSAIAAGLWLGAIVLLHFIKPELDPRSRMISEYALGSGGWVMQLAFFCMAMSCWALALATLGVLPPVGLALLAVCGFGFAGAGVFVTDPVGLAERSQTRSGALHVMFAFTVILLFPIMATVVAAGIAGSAARIATGFWLPALSALTWAGCLSFLGAALYSGRHRRTPLGYFERFLVLTYSVWLIVIGLGLAA